jgi:hypothetical protein
VSSAASDATTIDLELMVISPDSESSGLLWREFFNAQIEAILFRYRAYTLKYAGLMNASA